MGRRGAGADSKGYHRMDPSSLPPPPPPPPPPSSPRPPPPRTALLLLAQQLLVAAYTRLFQEGELLDRAVWAQERGYGRAEVTNAVNDLSGRNLLQPAA